MIHDAVRQIRHALQLHTLDIDQAQQWMSPIGRPPRRPTDRPGAARLGAVLLMVYLRDGEPYTVFVERSATLKHHAGQVSFPGGRQEPSETFWETALRETHEEIGIPPQNVQLLGELAPVYIPPSDFNVYPFVGWHAEPPQFSPSPDEVASLLEVPLSHLRRPEVRVRDEWQYPFFRFGSHRIWGGTAVILNEFIERLALRDRQAATKP